MISKNIITVFVFLLILSLANSCKVSDQLLIGRYKLGSFKNSELIIDSNNHFRYLSDNYRLVINNDHYFYTEGTWSRTSNDMLLLNSAMDSIPFIRYEITSVKGNGNNSKFTFINAQSDTILIRDVYKNSKIAFYRSHGPFLNSWEGETKKLDTLTFTFTIGYRPIEIYIDSIESRDYCVTVFREIKPNYFENAMFKIRKNKLVELPIKEKYVKIGKNGM